MLITATASMTPQVWVNSGCVQFIFLLSPSDNSRLKQSAYLYNLQGERYIDPAAEHKR
jgi:hypothetical protein